MKECGERSVCVCVCVFVWAIDKEVARDVHLFVNR